MKIGFLGGDRRMLSAAASLSGEFECALWGYGQALTGESSRQMLCNCVRCADWSSAVKAADAVILPLPASKDGKTLNMPLGEGEPPKLLDVVREMKVGASLFGGKLPFLLKEAAAESGVEAVDYYEDEALQIRNAVPTAEGAIAACISALPVTVAGMRTAVSGYGRVGRTLAQRLKSLGAEVYAVARNPRDLAWAACDGCIPVKLDEYRKTPVWCTAVFNTVPVRIFDEELLAKLPVETVIFELATASAGVDTEAAKSIGIRVIPLDSLPGKTSPDTAGEIIADAVRSAIYAGGGHG